MSLAIELVYILSAMSSYTIVRYYNPGQMYNVKFVEKKRKGNEAWPMNIFVCTPSGQKSIN